MISCPQCHRDNRPNAKFCVACGYTLLAVIPSMPASSFSQSCLKCGSVLDSTASFCTSCGTPRMRTDVVPVDSSPAALSSVASITQPSMASAHPASTSPAPHTAQSVPAISTSSAVTVDSANNSITVSDRDVTCSVCGTVVRFCSVCGATLTQSANGQMVHNNLP